MKKQILMLFLSVCTLYTYAQSTQTDSARMAGYREKIGLDLSIPDFECKKIDEAKIGTRLANLLRYFEEIQKQGYFARCVTSILADQYEEFRSEFLGISKVKLQKVSKTANEITIIYKVWLEANSSNIKQTEVLFHFTDGVSENKNVNELFSNMSSYVQAREKQQK